MTYDPNKRISAEEAYQHEWIQKTITNNEKVSLSFMKNMQLFQVKHSNYPSGQKYCSIKHFTIHNNPFNR